MIDLHMHTKYSDGSNSVINLLKEAEEAKLEIISITDHDEVGAYFELKNIDIKKYFNGKILPGVELRTLYKGRSIEILGYGIDVQKIKDSKYITNQAGDNKQIEYLEKFKEIGRSIGLTFDEKIYIGETNVFASTTFGREIYKYKENKPILEKYNMNTNKNDFYREGQTNPNSIFYIDEINDVFPLEIIINELHQAGGLAFLAHPFMYSFDNNLEIIEEIIKNYDLDGLECYHSEFNDEQTKQLLELCKKYNKYVSGGSDYHGEIKPYRKLGIGKGNLNITKDMFKDWIDKIL